MHLHLGELLKGFKLATRSWAKNESMLPSVGPLTHISLCVMP
jgi:hypothetical protein